MDKDAKCLSPSAIVSFLGKHNIKLRTVQRTQQQKWRNLCSNSDWWNSTLLSGNWLANLAPINKLMMQNEEIFFYKIEKTWIKTIASIKNNVQHKLHLPQKMVIFCGTADVYFQANTWADTNVCVDQEKKCTCPSYERPWWKHIILWRFGEVLCDFFNKRSKKVEW